MAVFIAGLTGLSPASAKQVDANTPTSERPVVEEVSYEDLKNMSQSSDNTDRQWLIWTIVAVLFGVGLISSTFLLKERSRSAKLKNK